MTSHMIFVNDAEHALRHLDPLLQQAGPARCTIVLSPPRLPHRIGKRLSRQQRDLWRRSWAEDLRQALELAMPPGASTHVDWLTANTQLPENASWLRQRAEGSLTVVDARKLPFGGSLGALQTGNAASRTRWRAPVAVTSSVSVVLALAD